MTRLPSPLSSSMALAIAISAGACNNAELDLPVHELGHPAWDSHVGEIGGFDREVLSGQYRLESQFDIDGGALFPDVKDRALRSLAALGLDTAKTMRMLGDEPLVQAVLD